MAEPGYDIAYPRGGSHHAAARARTVLRPLLVPATWCYAAASDTVRRVRSLERNATPEGVTVISIGNLEVGGSGKTPLCIHLLEWFAAAGRPVAYVSRGYGSRAERFHGVTVLGADGEVSGGVRWLAHGALNLPGEIGDEGAVVSRRVPGAFLAFSRDKARAVETIAAHVPGGVVIIDDAFQSWGVGRDIDIVLLDPAQPFGDGWMLPAGTLREGPEALERADMVVLNGAVGGDRLETVRADIRRAAGRELPCAVMRREIAVGNTGDGPVVAASAIARPDAFERSVIEAGVKIARALRFPDHHRFGAADVKAIEAACDGGRRRCVVTEKDWVKLRELGCSESAFVVARLDVHVDADVLAAIK